MNQITDILIANLGNYLPFFVALLIINVVLGFVFLCTWFFVPWLLKQWMREIIAAEISSRNAFIPIGKSILAELRALRMDFQASPSTQTALSSTSTALKGSGVTPPTTLKQKILILEDDSSIGIILVQMLKSFGYIGILTETGEDAIAAYEKASADLAPFSIGLFDLTIQNGMGGRETFQTLKSFGARLKAIACSGYVDEALQEELINEGFTDVLAKPFTGTSLRAMIEKHLPKAG